MTIQSEKTFKLLQIYVQRNLRVVCSLNFEHTICFCNWKKYIANDYDNAEMTISNLKCFRYLFTYYPSLRNYEGGLYYHVNGPMWMNCNFDFELFIVWSCSRRSSEIVVWSTVFTEHMVNAVELRTHFNK